MVIAAVNPNLQVTTDNSMSSLHGEHTMSLESVIDPASAHDVTNFHAIVQQSIAQNSPAVSSTSSVSGANPISKIAMGMVDSIHNSRVKMDYYASNFNSISAQGLLDLQKTTSDYSVTTQILSKVVATATKDIDALVHMQ